MSKNKINVLLIEDNRYDIKGFERLVQHSRLPYDYTVVRSIAETREILKKRRFDVIVADYHLEDGTLFEMIAMLRNIPLIITTGAGDEDIAVTAIKEGAYDYLSKDIRANYLRVLPLTIENAIRQKKTEKKIKMLSQAIMCINEGVYVTDTDDKIIFVNQAFCQLYGYREKDILGVSSDVLVESPVENEEIKEFLARPGKTGWKGERVHKKRSGEQLTVSLSSSVIKDEDGRNVAVVNVVSDITSRKKAEQELKIAKDAAEAANFAKSEFLARMSHEIRTPLNSIIGMTELMMDTELSEEQQEYLKVVNVSSHSLLNLVNELLDFSKIEARQIQLVNVNFNLVEIIQSVAEILSFCAKEKGLKLTYAIDPDLAPWVIGDPIRLRQVLVHLTGNAIKFTKKGSVAIEVKAEGGQKQEAQDHRVRLHFVVADTGIGIPPQQIEAMFQKFSQADTSSTRKFGGSGLGLSIARTLVHLMGGRMWAESKVGKGSKFHFELNLPVGKNPFGYENDSNPGEPIVVVVDEKEVNRVGSLLQKKTQC